MFQNIRVDIVYYKTGTDFEMEFNLCGCCRMRLLTDKTSDRQTLVHSLARAVSRSKVIMVVGSLFGDGGIISTVAGAIGSGLSVADNKACGINSNESIEIIEGSIPLVTPDGCFGGCIIENGPQTMILLSESKSIRKPIMQTLIHPYIEQLCADELKGKAAGAKNTEEEPENVAEAESVPEESAEAEALETEAAEISEENTSTESDETANSEPEEAEAEAAFEDTVTLSGGMSFEQDGNVTVPQSEKAQESEPELITEPMTLNRKASRLLNEAYVNFEEGLITDEEEPESGGARHFSELPILIISILLLVLIAFLCYCIFYVPASNGIAPADYLRDIYSTLFK